MLNTFASLLVLLFSFTAFAQTNTLSEGWYQILLGQKHIGYMVYRYELNPKNGQVAYTSFLKTNALGGDLTESLEAVSNFGFEPISYKYSLLRGKDPLTIDAKFTLVPQKEGSSNIVITEKNVSKTLKPKLPQGTFLSTSLSYVMMSYKNPSDSKDAGIKVGRSFSYNAIAEEDGTLNLGNVDVLGTEVVNGHDVFRVRVKYKNIQSISFMNSQGEVMQVNQPISGHQIKAATQEEAMKGFPSAEKSLKTLFKNIPGTNPLAIAKAAPVKPSANTKLGTEPELGKEEKILVPPGKPIKPSDPIGE